MSASALDDMGRFLYPGQGALRTHSPALPQGIHCRLAEENKETIIGEQRQEKTLPNHAF